MEQLMKAQHKLLAISGSTREKSSNLYLIKAIGALLPVSFSLTIFEGLTAIPHFNPDLDTEAMVPQQVVDFREQLRQADAVLVCTPEYAMGVPGTLKNAIDWTVSSCEFSNKPVALITASSSGEKAHESLLGTLKIIEARMNEQTQLHIPFIKTKIDASGQITDPVLLTRIKELIASLMEIQRTPVVPNY